MDDITRVCRKCGQEKPLEEFAKNKECVLGHSHTCKHCKREHACKYRADNHEKVLERTRKWRVDNPEKVREYDRKYRADNHEKYWNMAVSIMLRIPKGTRNIPASGRPLIPKRCGKHADISARYCLTVI